jgi:hypothetical protein
MQKTDGPLPAVLMEPWLADNAQFQAELLARDMRLGDLSGLRQRIEPQIRLAQSAEPCPLGAVDSASIKVILGDQLSILMQVIWIDGDGTPILGTPERITGIDGEELRLAETPMRLAAECSELAKAAVPTIADNSYWSFLMEVNQAITREANSSLPVLTNAVERLVDHGAFMAMLQNPLIVPMSKISQSDVLIKGVSDRQVLTQILQPDEFLKPRPLIDATAGKFGIEKRRFKDSERALIDDYYKRCLGVVFYKPHPWTRAFRIEGHLDHLEDDTWLMSLLAAIKAETAIAREVVEPWPQFMADYTAKRLSAVGKLYGQLNWHRHPEATYLHARTRR